MAPVLIANVLTVTFVYCFAEIHQKELAQEGGRSPHLSLANRSHFLVYALWAPHLGRLSIQKVICRIVHTRPSV